MKTTILMAFLAVILANCGSNATNPNMTQTDRHESKLGKEEYMLVSGKENCTTKKDEVSGSCTGKFKTVDKADKASRYKLAFSLDGKDSSFTLVSKSKFNDKGTVEGSKALIKFFHKEGQEFPQVEVTCTGFKTVKLPVKGMPEKLDVEVAPHGNHNHVHILIGSDDVEVNCGGQLVENNWGFILNKAKLTSAEIGAGTLPADHD